jgi:cytosine/uracil/thiamine/allantoin permease
MKEENIMDNDDAILCQILQKEAAKRRARPSFAQDVMSRLPERKSHSGSRRTLLITSFALCGCFATAAIAWSDLTRFADGVVPLMNDMVAVKQSLAGFILVSPIAFVVGLVSALYFIARRARLI